MALRNITKQRPNKAWKATKQYYKTKTQQNLKGHLEILQNKDPFTLEKTQINLTKQTPDKTWMATYNIRKRRPNRTWKHTKKYNRPNKTWKETQKYNEKRPNKTGKDNKKYYKTRTQQNLKGHSEI